MKQIINIEAFLKAFRKTAENFWKTIHEISSKVAVSWVVSSPKKDFIIVSLTTSYSQGRTT